MCVCVYVCVCVCVCVCVFMCVCSGLKLKHVADDLQRQASDPSSRLFSGVRTHVVPAVCISSRMCVRVSVFAHVQVFRFSHTHCRYMCGYARSCTQTHTLSRARARTQQVLTSFTTSLKCTPKESAAKQRGGGQDAAQCQGKNGARDFEAPVVNNSKRGKGTNISVDFRELLKEGLITGEEFKYLTSGASDASASTQVHMCR